MTLEDVRQKIDEIDGKLLPLFEERMDCSKEVARIKKGKGIPILNEAREQAILEKISKKARAYPNEARVLYSAIMSISRGLQHELLESGETLRRTLEEAGEPPASAEEAAVFGAPGSFSHEAAKKLLPGASPLFFPTFPEIFQAVDEGKAAFGILPVENSSAGSVEQVYDLILKYRFYIVGAETLYIHHCLCGEPGKTFQKVYSHPQALSQCSELISQMNLSACACSSTAEAPLLAKKEGQAAICSEEAAQKAGLPILQKDVQNNSNNCTRFIQISRKLYIPRDAGKISLCFSLPHTTGSLNSVLSRFAQAGLNLTKIESRPSPGRRFEYDFYLDFSGNVREPHTLKLLCSLSAELPRFSFLGNYTEED